MSKPIKDVLNQDEDSSNYSMNELIFISAQPKQEITKEVLNGTNMLATRSAGQKTEHPADELAFISQESPKEEEIEDAGSKRYGENLVVDELNFVSQLEKRDNDEEKPHTDHDGQTSGGELNQRLPDDLAFLSNSTPQPEITKEVLNGTNMLATRSAGQKTERPADELAFISQDSPKEKEIEDAGSKRNEDNLVDELKFVSQPDTSVDEPVKDSIKIEKTTQENLVEELQLLSNLPTKRKHGKDLLSNNNFQNKGKVRKKKQKQKEQFNIESSISTETKSNGSNGISTTSNLSTDKKNPSPIKHITAVFVFSVIAVLMTFANLRIDAVAELLHPSVQYKTTIPQDKDIPQTTISEIETIENDAHTLLSSESIDAEVGHDLVVEIKESSELDPNQESVNATDPLMEINSEPDPKLGSSNTTDVDTEDFDIVDVGEHISEQNTDAVINAQSEGDKMIHKRGWLEENLCDELSDMMMCDDIIKTVQVKDIMRAMDSIDRAAMYIKMVRRHVYTAISDAMAMTLPKIAPHIFKINLARKSFMEFVSGKPFRG